MARISNIGGGGGTTVSSLNDLTDVTITSVADKDLLTYDTASGLWVNAVLQLPLSTLPTAGISHRGKVKLVAGINSTWNTTAFNWNDTATLTWNDTTPIRDILYLCRVGENGSYEWTSLTDGGLWNAT